MLCGVSSQLGEITDEEIIARKNDLIVVQSHEGKYSLCQTGTDKIYPDKIVELPEGLELIAANAFYGNEYLEEISLPKSLKDIGKDAFKGCSNIKKIHVPQGTLSKYKELLPEWRAIIYEDQDGDLPFNLFVSHNNSEMIKERLRHIRVNMGRPPFTSGKRVDKTSWFKHQGKNRKQG